MYRFATEVVLTNRKSYPRIQRIVEIFEVDVNLYSRYVKAIDREIGLIKKWRQRDNRIRSQLKG